MTGTTVASAPELTEERIKWLKLCRDAENFGYVMDAKEQRDWAKYVVHTRKSTQD